MNAAWRPPPTAHRRDSAITRRIALSLLITCHFGQLATLATATATIAAATAACLRCAGRCCCFSVGGLFRVNTEINDHCIRAVLDIRMLNLSVVALLNLAQQRQGIMVIDKAHHITLL